MSRRAFLLLLALGALALLRLLLALHTEYIVTDSQIYLMMAEALHRGLPLDRIPLFHAIPTAIAVPWAVMQVVYVNSLDFLIHLGNIVSSAWYCGAVVALYFLAKRFLPPAGALAACAVFVLHDRAFAFSGIGEPYAAYAFFLTCFFLALLHHMERRSLSSALLLGLLLALCTFSRKEGILAFAVAGFSLLALPKDLAPVARLRLTVWPLIAGVAIVAVPTWVVYRKTGVLLNGLVLDVLLLKGGASMQYMLERESVTAGGAHAWYYRVANLGQYLLHFLISNLASWRLWSLFLVVGVVRTIRDRRCWPFYAYIVLHILCGLVTQYQVESDQLKSVATQFIPYDAARYQLPWLPPEAIIIIAGIAWIAAWIGIDAERFRETGRTALTAKPRIAWALVAILAAASLWNVVASASVEHKLIARGRYDVIVDPVRDFATIRTAQVPMLLAAKELRRMDIVDRRIAVLSRYTTSSNLIALGNFGGPNRYLSCSSGDWQWVDGLSRFVPGGAVVDSTIFTSPPPRADDGTELSCHDLADPGVLAGLGVEYVLLDRTMLSAFPQAQELAETWTPLATVGIVTLYGCPDATLDERTKATPGPQQSVPRIETRGLGISPPAPWKSGAIVAAGRTIFFIDGGDNEPRLLKQSLDLLAPLDATGEIFVVYDTSGAAFVGTPENETSRTFLNDFAAEVISTDAQGSRFAATYANSVVQLRGGARSVTSRLSAENGAPFAIRILPDGTLWFLTTRGESVLLDPGRKSVVHDAVWPVVPEPGVALVQDDGISFCTGTEFVKLSIPEGRELRRLPFDGRCDDLAGTAAGEPLFLSSPRGLFRLEGGRLVPIADGGDAAKLAVDDAGSLLASAGLGGRFVEWDATGRILQEIELGDAVIAKPSYADGIWHVLTEHGGYHRLISAAR